MKKHPLAPSKRGGTVQGFTLIEFIVIISIFAVMASVALFNFNGFRSNVGLNNLAHDIGLTIRQAQVFGWVTQSASSSGAIALDSIDPLTGNPVRFADGVYFDSTTLGTEFILYRKTNENNPKNYETGLDSRIDTIKINGPYVIEKILSSPSKADLKITTDNLVPTTGLITTISDVSIAFTRPKPEAVFFSGVAPITDSYVAIYIRGTTDPVGSSSHVVIVSRTGEIDVQ
jgi:prepilin-type N-terminal cleavage/methylation domain-containing protein